LFPEALENIEALFERAGREMTELNKTQAEIPDKCEMIQNKLGTAPGMWIEEEGKIFVSMPGVPYEMKAMMKNIIIPKIQKKLGNGNIHHKIIKTVGIPESKLADKIKDWENQLPENIKLAYLPSLGQVKLRLTSIGDDLEQIKEMTSKQVENLLPLIDKYVYGYDDDELEAVIGKLLSKNNHTLATAESCTGGYLAHLITSIPGSSDYYKGSVISYANEVKIDELYVSESDIENYGAVSEEVVSSMAVGVRKRLNTDVALATSGVAGPDGGSEEKPVGTVWIAYADKYKVIVKKLQLTKDRKLNIQFSSIAALNLLRINYK
jgi:nicotinamide-nucleotide amidase